MGLLLKNDVPLVVEHVSGFLASYRSLYHFFKWLGV